MTTPDSTPTRHPGLTMLLRPGIVGGTLALATAATAAFAPAASAAPTTPALKADYRLQDTRSSTVAGAPELLDLGAGNAFVGQPVDGTGHEVLTFARNHGVQVKAATPVVPSGGYSIVLLARLNAVDGYRRLVDLKRGSADDGLYASDRSLSFYGGGRGVDPRIKKGQYAQVVLTRDAVTSVVTGYVNGAQQFSFTDTSGAALIAGGTINFFRDNNASGGVANESSAGAVARIRLYDGPLSATQVSALDREP